MVKQIQLTEEYYDLEEEDDDEYTIFSAPTYFTTEEQLVLIACLMLLEQRYRLMKSMTLEQIQDEIEEIMASLESELDSVAYNQAYSHIHNYFLKVLDEFSIPYEGYVSVDTSMIELMQLSLGNAINQLRDEIKVKVAFFEDNLSKDTFNLIPNFKRAVQKVIDAVGNNLIHGKEKSRRNVLKFVYGEDKLYRWLTMNDSRVCEWCLIQQSLPPRTLDEMPLDHPRGRCTIDPIDEEYSDMYYLMLARSRYADEIEMFSTNDWENNYQ